jgi:hypothetical protein
MIRQLRLSIGPPQGGCSCGPWWRDAGTLALATVAYRIAQDRNHSVRFERCADCRNGGENGAPTAAEEQQRCRPSGEPVFLDPAGARGYISRRMTAIGTQDRLRRRTSAPAPVRDR